MLSYVAQRLALAVCLLLAVSALTFSGMNLLGDPLVNILGPIAADTENPKSIALIEAAEAEYHLDKSLPERYVRWLGDLVRGDLGVQFSSTGEPPVSNIIKERAPRTAVLLVMAQSLAVLISIPWALLAASRARRPADRISTVTSFLLIALPNFALAVILKYLLAIKLGWFPITYTANDPFLSRIYQTFLPALTIALPAAAVYQRLLRTDLITTLQEDFILMARAKGVSKWKVLLRHALRPSFFSFITVFGINTGALIGGSLVVETIFRIPGLGTTIVEAIIRDDFPVVLAVVMIATSVFVLVNVLVDILYSFLDPRVKR
ncbi:MAG: ABC transporter permease [Ilumatobacteraceae bacterium]|jgi:peptide/nickel transport system permease protein|nr:ABC transporter permease [Gammaproteobacteria bacterium]